MIDNDVDNDRWQWWLVMVDTGESILKSDGTIIQQLIAVSNTGNGGWEWLTMVCNHDSGNRCVRNDEWMVSSRWIMITVITGQHRCLMMAQSLQYNVYQWGEVSEFSHYGLVDNGSIMIFSDDRSSWTLGTMNNKNSWLIYLRKLIAASHQFRKDTIFQVMNLWGSYVSWLRTGWCSVACSGKISHQQTNDSRSILAVGDTHRRMGLL